MMKEAQDWEAKNFDLKLIVTEFSSDLAAGVEVAAKCVLGLGKHM